MIRRFCSLATVFGVLAVSAGCSSSARSTAITADTRGTTYLGAGDSLGWSIAANQNALARALQKADTRWIAEVESDH